MIEVISNFFVGNEVDYERIVRGKEGWAVVHACKEPHHRNALGYSGRAAPKTHPEYLIARRGDRLILNLVDVDSPAYISVEIIDSALLFIHEQLNAGKKVLVHCNQGASRSAGIALLYMALSANLPQHSFEEAEQAFIKVYPACAMAGGIRGFLIQNWSRYRGMLLS